MDRVLRRQLLTLLLAVGGPAACGSTDGPGSDDAASTAAEAARVTVTVKTFAFSPDPLEVRAGTVITFVNEDDIDHTVTAGTREAPHPQRFDGQLPGQDARFELMLDAPGTYEYFCQIHPGPGMTAVITVH